QVMAQEEPTKIVCGDPYVDKENIIRRFVQQKAEPQEGMEKFKENFIKEFDQTIISSEEKEVRFLLRFVVEKDGSFTDIKIVGEDEYGVENEAIRVLKTMPKWKPALYEGEIVRSAFTVIINFELDDIEQAEYILYGHIIDLRATPKEGMQQFRKDFLRKFKVSEGIPPNVKQVSITMLFTVEKDGELTNIRVVEDKYGLGQEAIRVLKTMPKWLPARYMREPIKKRFQW